MTIVIGGGAAGLMAGGTAAANGDEVVIIEKNNKCGKKIRITGKGRCNITNACEFDEFFTNIPFNSKFLYSAFSKFSNYDCIDFFENLGVATKVERGKRVFPVSDDANDVAETLIKHCLDNKVKFRYNSVVREILVDKGQVKGVRLMSGEDVLADKVILATGGASYPVTGSDGGGYKVLERLGHKINEAKAALVPINVREDWTSDIAGLTLKNIEIKLENGMKFFGEALFTHFGLSGPAVLTASCHIEHYPCKFFLDLKPALDLETLDKRIQRDFAEFANRDLINALDKLLPMNLIPIIIKLAKIDERIKVNQITKEQRLDLVKTIKNIEFNSSSSRPIDEAVVTAGGVDLKEVNPSTMESKIVKGLYLAGEVLDIFAYTGGFNLQIAFSTGKLAGMK